MTKFLLAWIMLLCSPVPAQTLHEKRPGVPDSDRPVSDARSFMELFSKLENNVETAVNQKDALTLDATLAPEFIVRSADDPTHPILRADWIHQALGNTSGQSYTLDDFAIRAFATEAIVTYVQHKRAMPDAITDVGGVFIVDLWVVNHGKWQLAARYPAPICKSATTDR